MGTLGTVLTYRWVIASAWNGDGTLIHPLNITSQWKPILIFSKGDWKAHGRIPDLLRNDTQEKRYHPWQQPEAEVMQLVSFLSQPGQLVVDPCAGSFTTAVACKRLGRRFVGCDVDADCVRMGHGQFRHQPVKTSTAALTNRIAHTVGWCSRCRWIRCHVVEKRAARWDVLLGTDG
jgi:site-specific DNA-methyltransferase (adenine-specific)